MLGTALCPAFFILLFLLLSSLKNGLIYPVIMISKLRQCFSGYALTSGIRIMSESCIFFIKLLGITAKPALRSV